MVDIAQFARRVKKLLFAVPCSLLKSMQLPLGFEYLQSPSRELQFASCKNIRGNIKEHADVQCHKSSESETLFEPSGL